MTETKKCGENREKRPSRLKELISADINIRKYEIEMVNYRVKFTVFLILGFEENMYFKDVFSHST